ncbi:hypothetical protein [Parapedobacter tibetensis]|nr:hypothetical protein [Parapedobacter tibetensis]
MSTNGAAVKIQVLVEQLQPVAESMEQASLGLLNVYTFLSLFTVFN